jgi:hypothetical protein
MMTDQSHDDRGLWRKALFTVPLIVVTGSLIGILSNSGDGNGWYAQLDKPDFQPPNWSFGANLFRARHDRRRLAGHSGDERAGDHDDHHVLED